MSSTSGVPRSTRPAPIGDESWFGAFGPTTDSSTLTGESQIGASWQGDSSSAVRAVRTRRGLSTTFERAARKFRIDATFEPVRAFGMHAELARAAHDRGWREMRAFEEHVVRRIGRA